VKRRASDGWLVEPSGPERLLSTIEKVLG